VSSNKDNSSLGVSSTLGDDSLLALGNKGKLSTLASMGTSVYEQRTELSGTVELWFRYHVLPNLGLPSDSPVEINADGWLKMPLGIGVIHLSSDPDLAHFRSGFSMRLEIVRGMTMRAAMAELVNEAVCNDACLRAILHAKINGRLPRPD